MSQAGGFQMNFFTVSGNNLKNYKQRLGRFCRSGGKDLHFFRPPLRLYVSFGYILPHMPPCSLCTSARPSVYQGSMLVSYLNPHVTSFHLCRFAACVAGFWHSSFRDCFSCSGEAECQFIKASLR